MSFIDTIKEKAKKNIKRIILPETMDIRVLEAAEKCVNEKIADIILKPFMSLPGFIKMLVTFGFAILIVIGAICVARKALKTVVGIACLFVIVLIVWLIISR